MKSHVMRKHRHGMRISLIMLYRRTQGHAHSIFMRLQICVVFRDASQCWVPDIRQVFCHNSCCWSCCAFGPSLKMTHEGCHQLYACNLQMLQDARKPNSVCVCFFLARCMLLVPRTSIITNSIHDVQLFCCLALFALDMFAHGVCYEACRVVGKLENQKNTSFVLFRGTRPRQPFPASGLAAMLPPCSWETHVPMGTSIWKDALQTNPPQAEEGTTANTHIEIFFAVFWDYFAIY